MRSYSVFQTKNATVREITKIKRHKTVRLLLLLQLVISTVRYLNIACYKDNTILECQKNVTNAIAAIVDIYF